MKKNSDSFIPEKNLKVTKQIMKVHYKLYQMPLCPFSRKVRVFLAEKNINADLAIENFWEKRKEFLKLNPLGQIPVLLNYDNGECYTESSVICEYLEEKHGGIKLVGDNPEVRAEVKKISHWFDYKFFPEVTNYVLNEKVIKYYQKKASPDSLYIRAAKINLEHHLKFITHLLQTRKWLAGNKISMADITAACQLSVIDYLEHLPWNQYPQVKEWYMLVKSRPSFTNILQDHVTGFKPSENYNNLDF